MHVQPCSPVERTVVVHDTVLEAAHVIHVLPPDHGVLSLSGVTSETGAVPVDIGEAVSYNFQFA